MRRHLHIFGNFILFVIIIFLFSGCPDPGNENDPSPANPNSRGLTWVRNNEMAVSGHIVSMGPPPARFVNNYFGGFNATAAQFFSDAIPDTTDAWMNVGRSDFRYISHLSPDGLSTSGNGKIIGGYPADSFGRIGFQIGDEPAHDCAELSCAVAKLNRIAEGMNAVRKADPDALIYTNFKVSDFAEDLLIDYCENLDGDVISYDRYNYDDREYEHLALFRNYGLKYSKPYWRYIRAHNDEYTAPNPAESDLRWQAFVGLVYGYTGFTWFIYNIDNTTGNHDPVAPLFFDRRADFDAIPNGYWQIAARINRELTHLGRSVTQLTSTDVRYVRSQVRIIPAGMRDWEKGAGGDKYITGIASRDNLFLELLTGFFEDSAGEIYIMVQNVSRSLARLPINAIGTEVVRISFDFSKAPGNVSRQHILSLDKQSGKIVRPAITETDTDKGYVDVTLAAGDPVLIKYDNGKAFARR